MPQPTESIQKIFEDYHRFDDGLIVSFEYFYPEGGALAVKIMFYARNHSLNDNVWRNVRIIMHDVKELNVKVRGNQFQSISSGVKLLRFEDVWCIDVDGVFTDDEDPATLEEVRELGLCYVVGNDIEAYELDH
ncbi:hypothetical protein J3P77_14770 [Pseudomonas sp. R1-18]|uniref:hypothetical protein n=1 Tax=Pseudomonas sp. R1-18 TaxID=1632772 RepID=UPI003DA973A9